MHFVRAGRGAPALIFVHGFACTHADWKAQLDFFSRTHEVVACDLRGHGDTPGRAHECSIEHYGGDVAALVNNLDLERAVLIGHSMGCRVVLEANRISRERIAAIVLVDGSRLASGDPDAAESAAHRTIENAGYARFAEHLFRQMFFRPSALADEIIERAVRSSADFGPVLWPRMARWDAERMDEALGSVRSPLLAIQTTTRDAQLRRTPLKPGDASPWLQLLADAVPDARLEIISGVGHFPQLEAPDEVNRLLSEFVSPVR